MNIEEYDFLLNEEGDLILLFRGFEEKPEKPFLMLASSDLSLTRSENMPVLCFPNVSASVLEKLEKCSHLLLCEVNEEGEPMQAYEVPIRKKLNA